MNLGIGLVNGMARITPGRDASKYAPLGYPPEYNIDGPVWVIATHGWIDLILGPRVRGATCVVIDGDWGRPAWRGGDEQLSDGRIATPEPEPAPVYALPSLAP
jgi:hypothetical protein